MIFTPLLKNNSSDTTGVAPRLIGPVVQPRGRDLWILFIASMALRLLIAAVAIFLIGMSIHDFARLYDGNSYLITARAILGDQHEFNDYHGRVFFGLPVALAGLGRMGLPMHIAGPLLNWLGASIASVFAALLFKDMRVGWATSILFPHTLMNSCLTMSESPMLALSLAGIITLQLNAAARSQNKISPAFKAGLLMGLAMIFRPMACFALGACALCELFNKKWKSAIILTGTAGLVSIAALFLQGYWRDDIFANFRYQARSPVAYGGRLFDWPMRSLLIDPFQRHVATGRILYMALHAVILLPACVMALRTLRLKRDIQPEDQINTMAAIWLLSNTLFVISLGSPWGFECFHRFTIPAAPALWWFLRPVLPKQTHIWFAIAAISAGIALATIRH